MLVWYFYPKFWILPLFGLLVGYATNWLALKLIFNPIEPISFLGVKYQGLFIFHYEMFKKVTNDKDEKWLEQTARFYSASEPHFTGFDGDAYRQTKEAK